MARAVAKPTTGAVSQLDTFGYCVLRGYLEVEATGLAAECEALAHEAFPGRVDTARSVPMTQARTPVSLALMVRLSAVAAEMLGAPVLPAAVELRVERAATPWHRDTALPVRSLGFLFPLDPHDDASALRVVPGSHRPQFGEALEAYTAHAVEVPGVALPTAPGDALVLDEHLFHGGGGPGERRIWRADFVADLPGDDDTLRRYFAARRASRADVAHDLARYPTYGGPFRALDRRWNERLAALGANGAPRA